MGVPGRKSWVEELKIAQRYADLSEPYFQFFVEMYNSEDKADKKWANEQLSKAFVKMIPQDMTSGGERIGALEVKIIRNAEDSDEHTRRV